MAARCYQCTSPIPRRTRGTLARDDPPVLPPGGLHGSLRCVLCCVRRPPGGRPSSRARADVLRVCGRRHRDHRAARRRGSRGPADVADPRLDPRRRGRDRGPALLPAPRDRRSRDHPGLLREPPGRDDRGGRLDDHPAAREEPVHGRRPDARSQAERGLPRLAARGPALEGGDPHPLPEHRVLRTGGLRRAGRRPDVLRRRRPRSHPRAVRAARGSDHQPRALRSVRVPAPGAREAPRGPPPDARVRDDHRGPAS